MTMGRIWAMKLNKWYGSDFWYVQEPTADKYGVESSKPTKKVLPSVAEPFLLGV